MSDKEKKYERKPNRSFPLHILENALIIAKTIQEKNAGKPMKRLLLADAIGRKPSTVQFRDLLSSSYKYGLTLGTEKAENIELTKLGEGITKPISKKQEIESKQKAVLVPDKFKEIYLYYKDAKFPSGSFFENTLEVQFKIPRGYVEEVIDMLEKNGRFTGIIRDISGSPHVMFDNFDVMPLEEDALDRGGKSDIQDGEDKTTDETLKKDAISPLKKKRVFITHGKNKSFIDPIKKLLQFGELEAVVSVEKQSVSQPVPDKVMNDMRSCGAAIIHIDAEDKLIDKEAKEQVIINPNVLIEIGAAMALFGRRFILLVKDGIKLPSNLQGLYVVKYEGDTLNGEVTIKLLEAINEMKKVPYPNEEENIEKLKFLQNPINLPLNPI